MAILQTLGVASCLGGPMRLCGYAAEMLHDEFDRQNPEQKRLNLQYHIDLDFIGPEDAPGVETPVQGGIKARELLEALSLINRHPKICGLEISEFNPEKDSKINPYT